MRLGMMLLLKHEQYDSEMNCADSDFAVFQLNVFLQIEVIFSYPQDFHSRIWAIPRRPYVSNTMNIWREKMVRGAGFEPATPCV
jgi:hypothetical protein